MQRLIKQGSLHATMLGTLRGARSQPHPGRLAGEIYRFVTLDPNEPWFNTVTSEPATKDEVGSISIPKHLLPHLQRILFDFRPKTHTLYYVAHDRKANMAPSVAVRFFEELLNSAAQKLEFPAVEVTAIPEAEAIEKVLKLPNMSRLEIQLKAPNADDIGDLTKRLMARLEAQSARHETTTLTAKRNEVLKPDEETRQLAKVAAKNGKVTSYGRDAQNLPIEDSTVNRPMVRSVQVDDDLETTAGVLERFADEEDR